jgi:hypothetical protein
VDSISAFEALTLLITGRLVLSEPSPFVQPAEDAEKTAGADTRAYKDAQSTLMQQKCCYGNTVANDREDNPHDQAGQPQGPEEGGLTQPRLVRTVLIHQAYFGPPVSGLPCFRFAASRGLRGDPLPSARDCFATLKE